MIANYLSSLRSLSLASQRRLPAVAALVVCLALTIVFFVLGKMTASQEARRAQSQSRLEKISSLVSEISAAEPQRPDGYEALAPLAIAQKVTRGLGLEAHLTSVRPSQLSGGQESVTLVYEALDLRNLLDLLQGLQDKGGLTVFSASLTRRLDDKELADLQLVLTK